MKRFLILFIAFASVGSLAMAKSKDVTLRPGETVYLQFDASGKKLKFLEASTEPNPQAQVTFSLQREDAKKRVVLRVENKLPKDLSYRAEMRSVRYNLKSPAPVTPVVAGKLAIDSLPELLEELTVYDFAYGKYQPAPETPRGR